MLEIVGVAWHLTELLKKAYLIACELHITNVRIIDTWMKCLNG